MKIVEQSAKLMSMTEDPTQSRVKNVWKVLVLGVLALGLCATAGESEPERGADLNTVLTSEAEDVTIEPVVPRAPWTRTYSSKPGLHVVVGNATQWVVYNFDKAEGWSLSGYARVKVDRQFRRRRWKFGIVNDPDDDVTGMWNRSSRFHGAWDQGIRIGIRLWGEF